MKKKIALFINATFVFPFISFAAGTTGQFSQTQTLLESLATILTTYLIPMAFSLALLYFFYGVAQYVRSAGDKEEGKKIMWWGVVALFVMSCVWGLVTFIRSELGVNYTTSATIPTITTQ